MGAASTLAALATLVMATSGDPGTAEALTLEWSAPSSCPSEPALRSKVAALVEGAPLRDLSANVTIVASGEGWTLTLQFESTRKVLQSPTCSELVDAAAVILSLALSPDNPETASEASPPLPEPAPEPPPPSEPPAKPETAPPSTAPTAAAPPASPHALLRVDGGIGVGISPTLTTGRVAVGLSSWWGRVELTGMLWTPADAADSRPTGDRLLVTMGTVALRGCAVPRRRVVSFPLCGGFGLGALRVGDRTATQRRTTHRLVPSASSSVGLLWMFSERVGLWAAAEAELSLRPNLNVALLDSTTPYRPGPAAVRASFGFEVHFLSRIRRSAGNRTR